MRACVYTCVRACVHGWVGRWVCLLKDVFLSFVFSTKRTFYRYCFHFAKKKPKKDNLKEIFLNYLLIISTLCCLRCFKKIFCSQFAKLGNVCKFMQKYIRGLSEKYSILRYTKRKLFWINVLFIMTIMSSLKYSPLKIIISFQRCSHFLE